MNERYRKYLDAAPDPWEARYTLIGYARTHGVRAAVRMSGANRSTVYRLIQEADTGRLRRRPLGGRHLTLADEHRIIAARLAMPGAGPKRLKRELGLPYGTRQISRVLKERGFARHWWRHDPTFNLDMARIELMLSKFEAARGWATRRNSLERARLKVMKLKEKMARWNALPESKRTPPTHTPMMSGEHDYDDVVALPVYPPGDQDYQG
ncbi:MAG: hypothetical protein ACYS9X_10655 [Planctomycetota bacterium]|jgi:transposase